MKNLVQSVAALVFTAPLRDQLKAKISVYLTVLRKKLFESRCLRFSRTTAPKKILSDVSSVSHSLPLSDCITKLAFRALALRRHFPIR